MSKTKEHPIIFSNDYIFVTCQLIDLDDKLGIKLITDFDKLYKIAEKDEELVYRALGTYYFVLEDHFSKFDSFKEDLPSDLFGSGLTKEMIFQFYKLNRVTKEDTTPIIEILYENLCENLRMIKESFEHDEKISNNET